MAFQTLQQLVSDVRTNLSAAAPREFSDVEIIQFLNYAWKDLSNEAELLKTSNAQTVTAGTADYTLPTDCAQIFEVYCYKYRVPAGDDRQWMVLTGDGTGSTTQGKPRLYMILGRTISLFPIPDTTVSSGASRLIIVYLKEPVDLTVSNFTTDLQTLGVQPMFYRALVDYASSECWAIMGDMTRAGFYRQRYLEGVEKAKAVIIDARDRFSVVKDDEAMYWDWFSME